MTRRARIGKGKDGAQMSILTTFITREGFMVLVEIPHISVQLQHNPGIARLASAGAGAIVV